jgi:hypothetical protein
VSFVVVALGPPVSTTELPLVVAFWSKQSDCVTFVPLPAVPTDVPLGPTVAPVSLSPPVACTG